MEEKRIIKPIMESLKSTDKSFTIRTHGYSHETRPVLDCTRVRVSQTHLVLLARMLKCSKGTKCTQFVDRHVQIGLHMRATDTGPVYRQSDKDMPSHELSNNTYMYIVLLNTYIQIRCIFNKDLICKQFELSIIPLDKQFVYNTTDVIFSMFTRKLNYNIC